MPFHNFHLHVPEGKWYMRLSTRGMCVSTNPGKREICFVILTFILRVCNYVNLYHEFLNNILKFCFNYIFYLLHSILCVYFSIILSHWNIFIKMIINQFCHNNILYYVNTLNILYSFILCFCSVEEKIVMYLTLNGTSLLDCSMTSYSIVLKVP